MATDIKFKRSAVPGKSPNTAQLALGEIAINTYDGILYLEKNDGSPSIRSLPTANDSGVYEVLSTANISANVISVNNFIDLTPRDHPTHNEGRFFYDNVHKTLNFNNDITNLQFELGTNEYIRVYNETGDTIPNGAALYLEGYTSTNPVVPKAFLADATDSVKYNTSGLAAASIANGAFGYCVVSGVVRGSDADPFDTSYLTAGERAFVSASTPGDLQQPAPQYPNFPMCMGLVVVSDANTGVFVVEQQMHAVPQFRVAGDVYVGADLTVAGDLSVLGSETVTTLTNISVADTFMYLGTGDTISNTQFTGSGLNDALYEDYYNGTETKTYSVRIDGVGTGTGGVDTFEWSVDDFVTTEATGVDITGDAQLLEDHIKIHFEATTGHTSGDRWDGDVAPSNLDFGIGGNYSNSTLYSHAGMFRDATDGQFKFFKRYDPEVEGNIDISNSTFQYADLRANSFFGHTITANVVGSVTGTVTDISNHDTGDLTEGTNLYYTVARANSAIDARVTKAFVNALAIDYSSLTGTPANTSLHGATWYDANNTLRFIREDATTTDVQISFSEYVNPANTSLSSASWADANNTLTFTRADETTFDTQISFSEYVNPANTSLSSAAWADANNTLTFTRADATTTDVQISFSEYVNPANTSLSSAAWADANNTLTFTRADSTTTDVQINFSEYVNPANTSVSSAAYTASNNTTTFTRADASTFDLTMDGFDELALTGNTTFDANLTITSNSTTSSILRTDTTFPNVLALGANNTAGIFIRNHTGVPKLGVGVDQTANELAVDGNVIANNLGLGELNNVASSSVSSYPLSIKTENDAMALMEGRGTYAYAQITANGAGFSGLNLSANGQGTTSLRHIRNASAPFTYVSNGDFLVTTSGGSIVFAPNGNTTSLIEFTNGVISGNGSSITSVDAATVGGNTAADLLNYNNFTNTPTIPANTSINSATWDDANNTLVLQRADESTTNVVISFSEYVNPANTSLSSAAWADANNTLTFTRADATTTDVQISFSEYLTATGNGASLTSVNADTLDGIQGSSFLRSDTADTALKVITFSANTIHNGRVGIGNSTPGHNLSVTGNGQFTTDLTVGRDLTISGNLTVSGTTTTINTTDLSVNDAVITLNSGQATPLNDIGLLMQRYSTANSTNYNVGIVWDESADQIVIGTTPEDGNDNDISVSDSWMTVNGDVAAFTTNASFYSGVASAEFNIGRSNSQKFQLNVSDGVGYIDYDQDETDGTNHSVRFRINSSSGGANLFDFQRPILASNGDVTVSSSNLNIFGTSGSDTQYLNLGVNGNRYWTLTANAYNTPDNTYDLDINNPNYHGHISFGSNNNVHMKVSANGNIGIGTTTPGRELTVIGSAANSYIYLDDGATGAPAFMRSMGSGEAEFGLSTNFVIKRAGGDARFLADGIDMDFSTDNGSSKHLWISSNGNVGVSNSTPIHKFSVSGNSHFADTVYINKSGDYWPIVAASTTGSKPGGGLKVEPSSGYALLQVDGGNGTAGATNLHYLISYGPGHTSNTMLSLKNLIGDITFNANNDSSDSERMRICANGNIGIGNTAPTHKLSVNGSAYFQSLSGNGASLTSVDAATLQGNTVADIISAAGGGSNTFDLNARATGINIDTAYTDKLWSYIHSTGTTDGTHPTNYTFTTNLGGDSGQGTQIASAYGSSHNYYIRRGSDNNSAENGPGWQPWHNLWTSGNDGSGSGLDADTVDGIQASSFLRSDAADTATGVITFSANGDFNSHVLVGDQVIFDNRTASDDHIRLYTGATEAASYGIGIESNTLYYRSANVYRWYRNTLADGGTSDIMQLDASGLTVAANLYASSSHTSNWFRSSGTSGLYFSSYGGGIYMTDGNHVKVYNQKGFWVNATTSSTNTSTGALVVAHGGAGIAGDIYAGANVIITNHLSAATKSFLINHPTKENHKLRYGSLEGPENGVYVRGRLKGNNTIELPEYWIELVDEDSITVELTPIGKHQKLYVEDFDNVRVVVGNDNLMNKEINCFYIVYGERKDVDKLEVEFGV